MTTEEKQLLLKDISFRLTNKVCCSFSFDNDTHIVTGVWGDSIRITGKDYTKTTKPQVEMWVDIKNIKPYLRPMKSMTDKEYEECHTIEDRAHLLIDWFNAHHFDYRHLIEKGLALEAQEGMYKSK